VGRPPVELTKSQTTSLSERIWTDSEDVNERVLSTFASTPDEPVHSSQRLWAANGPGR
jgi:hypothetical protein